MRPWFQFRISTILLLMVTVAMAASWWLDSHRLRRQLVTEQASLQALKSKYRQEKQAIGVVRASLHLRREVDLSGTNVTDAGLKRLSELSNLKMLILDDAQVTGSGFEYLSHLTNLRTLSLKHTLSGEKPELRDAGLEHLKGLKNLESLTLTGQSQITDAGIAHLKGLKNLRALYLTGTSVTKEGIEEFKKALPICQIDPDGTTGAVVQPRTLLYMTPPWDL